MRIQMVPLLAAGLLVVACGGGGSPQEIAETPDADPAKGKVDQEQVPEAPPDGGSMVVTYQDATSPEAIRGKELLEGDRALDDMADDINQTLNLPYDIPLLGAQCDQANAFWSPSEKTITICYEDTSNSERIFAEANDPDPVAGAINAEWATFYHEVGHMAITVYDLPVTGREEDVADQLAAYILLTPAEDGRVDPESVQAVKDFARVFAASGAQNTEIDQGEMADVHSLDLQRVFNLECWIYGSDPAANGDLVTSGSLPEDRAGGCQEEWQQVDKAWSTLLDPYFK